MSWEGPDPQRDEDRSQLTEGERLTMLYNSWITRANFPGLPPSDEALGERNAFRLCARELLAAIRG